MRALRLTHWPAILFVALSLSACELNAPPTPSASGAPLPQATALAPSAGSDPLSTPFPVSRQVLTQALHATQRSTAYRLQLEFQLATSEGGQTNEQLFLNAEAAIKQGDTHVSYNGGSFNEILGGGEHIEVVSVGGKTYLKGSRLFGAADADQWYDLGDSSLGKLPFDLGALMAQLNSSIEKAEFVEPASLDGLSCQVWRADFKAQAGSLIDVASAEINADEFNALDSAEAQLAPCADGYVHRMSWRVQAHHQKSVGDKNAIIVNVHLFDFNAANINIKAPDGALELK